MLQVYIFKMSISNSNSSCCKITLNYPSNTSVNLEDGSAGFPSLSFNSSPNTGIYKSASNEIGFSCSGVLAAKINTSGLNVISDVKANSLTSNTTISASSGSISSNLSAGSITSGNITMSKIAGPDGSSQNPTYTFNNQSNMGLFRSAGDQISLSIAGGTKQVWGSSDMTAYVPMFAKGGIQTFYKDGNLSTVYNENNGVPRFAISLDGTESKDNMGSNYTIKRYDDSGVLIDTPINISRNSGVTSVKALSIDTSNNIIGNVYSANYNPSYTLVSNLQSGSQAGLHFYQRVGNVVTVFGRMSLVCSTNNSSSFIFTLGLPVYQGAIANIIGHGVAYNYPAGTFKESAVRVYPNTLSPGVCNILVNFMTSPLAAFDTFECDYSFSYLL